MEAIEQSVAKQLRKITAFPDEDEDPDSDSSGDADASDVRVDGFFSQQQSAQQSILVAKKLQLLEKQLQHRNRHIERLQTTQQQAQQRIRSLQQELETTKQDFATAQDEWEDEKDAILRFRRNANPGGVGLTLLSTDARSRNKELELQRQREMRLKLLHGAADAMDDDMDLTDAMSTASGSRGLRLKIRRLGLAIRRRMYPFATDVRQIEARFGHSVASYFRFFRWIIMSFISISVPCVLLLVLHVLQLLVQETDWVAFVSFAPRFLLVSGYGSREALSYSVGGLGAMLGAIRGKDLGLDLACL